MRKEIGILGESFILHASGTVFWEEEKILLISDVHLGKISHFRKYGSALPANAVQGNFRKLSEVIAEFGPKKICFLGDLFHSSINQEWRLFEEWSTGVTAKMLLVKGNHDIISPLRYKALEVEVLDELRLKDFLFTHHPEERAGLFNFCGHVHPGIRLRGLGRQQVKLPCFYKTSQQMILPAFGEFTGKYIISPDKGSEVYVVAGEKVVLIPFL